MRTTVEEYLRDDYRWFAFNVVDLGKELVSKEAIQYRFKTSHLYYPLRISRTDHGETVVRLLVLSPNLVRVPDLRGTRVRVVHEPVRVNADDVRSIDKDIAAMFASGSHRTYLLRTWEIRAPLASFAMDVVTK
jgi:hypothetical protein